MLDIDKIDRLRAAAQAHGEVADLLELFSKGIYIDHGEVCINFDRQDCEAIESILVAAEFSAFDRRDL